MPSRRAWEGFAATLTLGAAGVHGGLTPAHLAEWWGYGLLFLAAAVAQAVLGLALALDALDSAKLRRAMYLAGAIGMLLLAALYLLTRTAGVPLAGPAQGETEAWGAIGVATLVAEMGAAAALLRLRVMAE